MIPQDLKLYLYQLFADTYVVFACSREEALKILREYHHMAFEDPCEYGGISEHEIRKGVIENE